MCPNMPLGLCAFCTYAQRSRCFSVFEARAKNQSKELFFFSKPQAPQKRNTNACVSCCCRALFSSPSPSLPLSLSLSLSLSLCVSLSLSSPLKRERNLLGTAYDWESNARPASFDDVRRRHQSLPANQLARVTAQYLQQQQQQQAGGAGAGAGLAEGGSSSGTAIVVAENPPALSGPGASRSLLSRVEPFGHDREANEVTSQFFKLVSFEEVGKGAGALNWEHCCLPVGYLYCGRPACIEALYHQVRGCVS